MKVRLRAMGSIAMLVVGTTVVIGATVRPAYADSVQVDFRLTLTSTFGDMSALGGGALGPGDTIPGRLVYDPAAPIMRPEPGFAEYRPDGYVQLGFGPGIILPLDGMIVVESYFVNAILQPAFVGAGGATGSFPGFDYIRTELEFRDGERTGLGLPTSAAELFGNYPRGFLRAAAWQTGVDPPFDSGTQEFSGTIAPVPEPATLLLTGAGLTMVVRRCRRSRRRLDDRAMSPFGRPSL